MKTIINIWTGEVENPAHIESKESAFEPGVIKHRFYRRSQMTTKGRPDARQKGQSIGISIHSYGVNGRFSFTSPGVEVYAQPIRDRIADLEKQLDAAKTMLAELYINNAGK